MSQQLSFDLPAKPALGRDDFFVSPSNALAVAMIDQPSLWPNRKLVLTGPAGSGKTHLTHVWAEQSRALVLSADALAGADIPELANGPVAIEDVPRIAHSTADQDAMFHLHNLVLANGHTLLMTGRDSPGRWNLSLPDLQSRVSGSQLAELERPDDALLAAILAKLFYDRQIIPRPDVIPYLVSRMDRSFAAAADVVDRLDQGAMAKHPGLSRALAIRLLGDEWETG